MPNDAVIIPARKKKPVSITALELADGIGAYVEQELKISCGSLVFHWSPDIMITISAFTKLHYHPEATVKPATSIMFFIIDGTKTVISKKFTQGTHLGPGPFTVSIDRDYLGQNLDCFNIYSLDTLRTVVIDVLPDKSLSFKAVT